ncbi:YcgL domain-containing protein [Larkinella punicea]|uniref:YcgL domain-containing protein n=1 Tax=Larkinella punicea TaxID=2315727 RepID=A0A368JLV9_9BACT|nr:YcgL domain-containing protein [Larkinella punicea]RCR68639.1 hypothetical protein DUE52_16155 [Larkinella punicea]
MITHIYQSSIHENWYLVLPVQKEDDFSDVPAEVFTEFGEPLKMESPDSGPGSLGIDLFQVRSDFDTQSYHVAKVVAPAAP